jgi:hypothetical protein
MLIQALDLKLEEARAAETISVLPAEVDAKYAEDFLLALYED